MDEEKDRPEDDSYPVIKFNYERRLSNGVITSGTFDITKFSFFDKIYAGYKYPKFIMYLFGRSTFDKYFFELFEKVTMIESSPEYAKLAEYLSGVHFRLYCKEILLCEYGSGVIKVDNRTHYWYINKGYNLQPCFDRYFMKYFLKKVKKLNRRWWGEKR